MATGARSLAVKGVRVNCFCAVKGAVLESLTATVKGKLVPAVVAAGVPVILPVFAFKLRPVGSAPDEMLQLSGVVPPVTVRIWS
jgi:hypothetical protein